MNSDDHLHINEPGYEPACGAEGCQRCEWVPAPTESPMADQTGAPIGATLVFACTLSVGDFIEFPDGYGEITNLDESTPGHFRVDGQVEGEPVTYFLRRMTAVRSWSPTESPVPPSGGDAA